MLFSPCARSLLAPVSCTVRRGLPVEGAELLLIRDVGAQVYCQLVARCRFPKVLKRRG
jgi:hypothetical protein